MRLSRGWLCAFFFALTTFICLGVTPIVDAQALGESSISLTGGLVIEGADTLVEGQSAAADRVRRTNPEAVAARMTSATAYQDLGVSPAEKLAGESFPALIQRRNGGSPQLAGGQRVIGFANPYAAQIELGDSSGQHALLESNVPMAMRASGGTWTPIDLSLQERNGGFEGADPLVASRLPKHLDEGAQLPSLGLSVTPVNPDGEPLGGSTGAIDGASEFVANSLVDSDSVLKLSTYGLSIDTILRSQSSPEQLSFRVGLPPGTHLAAAGDESGGVEIVKDRTTIASMPEPTAHDASGAVVPVSVDISGDVVKLTVSHAQGNYLYPVVVDPEFNIKSETTKREASTWPFTHEGTSAAGYNGDMWINQGSAAGQWGALNYVTKGDSKVYEISATTKVEPTQGGELGESGGYWVTSGESYIEFANSGGTEKRRVLYEPFVPLSESPLKTNMCANHGPHEECTAESGAGGNTVRFVLRTTNAGGGAQLRVQSASVAVSQPKETHSTVSYNTTSPEIEYTSGGKVVKAVNVFYGGGAWIGPNTGVFEFKSEDAGLGVSATSVGILKSGFWSERLARNYLTEGGACVGMQCAASQKEVVVYSQLSTSLVNGGNTIRVAAHDPMASTWSYEHGEGEATLNVDAAAPRAIAVTGLPSKGNTYELDETVGHLKIEATDGEGSTPSSGMKSIAASIDGKEIGAPAGFCPLGPCTVKGEWSINGGELGAGVHSLVIVATDNAGNVATKEYFLNVYEANAVSMGPGSLNPESGNFELEATDVSMSGGEGALTVVRHHNSRNPREGVEGPLGPQWTMGLGGSMASLEVLPDGSVMVDGPEGLTHFANKAGGGYEAPTGDTSLTLEAEKSGSKIVAYLLKNPSKGTTTKFTLPSGAKSWMPTVSQGPIATNTTTDEYTTAEPEAGKKIVEPTLEVAPHPSATCTFKKLEKGCRALEFNYAASTTATGEGQGEWGDYKGRLTRVYFIAWEPTKKEVTTTTVAQYAYDTQGRLRAEWNPQISPALKTVYGYDSEGHVTALTPPGQETWAFTYGQISGDATSGRLLRVTRAPASASLWGGSAPTNTAAPTLTPARPDVGVSVGVSSGTWSGSPVAYRYQWQRCNMAGASCVTIVGANNETYKPTFGDTSHKLRVEVQAINGGGSSAAYTAAATVVGPIPSYQSKFGSGGTASGQFKWAQGVTLDASGNVWVADTFNNRVQEFSSSGTFIREFGTAGTGNGQFKEPFGIAVTPEGNLWVLDTGNDRVQEFSSTGSYIKQFGSEGWGDSQFLWPNGITVTPEGNIWIADTSKNRLQEFSSTGAHIRNVGEGGSGNGQFAGPKGVASDAYGDVWVTDSKNNRVQEFSATGTYVQQFGSEGSGVGQFKETRGVTVDSTGEIWVTDKTNGRVQGFNASGEYLTQYGGEGQFNEPEGVAVSGSGAIYVADTSNGAIQILHLSNAGSFTYAAKFSAYGGEVAPTAWQQDVVLDASGNVWIADALNNRVEEFSASGVFMRQVGSAGSGNGQLNTPEGVAVTPEGNVWVVDSSNQRVQEFDQSGKYVRQFGSYGSAAGQFNLPRGIAILPGTGYLAIADQGNNRVQVFTQTGGFVREITGGTGAFALKDPAALAADAEGDLWVADDGDNRVEEFSTSGVYIRQFGSFGGGRGQFNGPSGISLDSNGDVWVTDTFNDRIEAFTSTGEFLTEYGAWGSGNGQFYDPNSVAVSSSGVYYVLDAGWGRVQEFTLPTATSESAPVPHTEGGALTTVEYRVPVSGSGAPYSMGSTEVAKWAQSDTPATATAIFPPDEPQGWPAQDYKRATVYYMDSHAHTTNIARSSGGISTTEYNEYGDVTRNLSVINRVKALGEGSKSQEVAKLLDTQNVYSMEGTRLTETFGPQHTVKIAKGNEKVASGSEVAAREHIKYYYNEGAPESGETFSLVTKTLDGAETAGKEEFDIRTSTKSYSGQVNLGWKLRTPTSVTTDPAGLKITHTTIFDETSGAIVETREPASTGPGNTHDAKIVYYTAAANGTYPACGGHIEWSGLPCESLPGKQPETSGLPELPVVTTVYNIWDQPEIIVETFGSTTRTKKTTFDSAGRPVKAEVTSTNGIAVPAVTDHYSTTTGAIVEESEPVEGVAKTIYKEYNLLGQMSVYTDADGGYTVYQYDIDGRTTGVTVYSPTLAVRDKQTYTYDATSGLMNKLLDSAAGMFTASYDVAGNMTSETYPNKMTATYTRNAVGQSTGVEYMKSAFCATSCPEKWFGDTVVPSVHGETLKQVSTLSEEPKESYDAAGRLTEIQEIPTGQGCTTRLYAYDEESNRTGLTTRAPGGEGKCATEGGTVEAHTYDSANRLIDSGISYETFGNITTLPAADAGGAGMEVTSTYYADNQLASQTQSGKTTSYYMDPAGRLRETRAPGVSVTHYAGSGSAVAWISEPESKWTVDVPGIDGSLSATKTSAGTVTLLLHDLQGDVVATAALDEKQTKVLTTYNSTEFGVPVNGAPPKYAWLGATGVASESSTGLVVQGGVGYVPQTGRPLQSQGVMVARPDNAASAYVTELAPWVIEGTAAMAKQLTSAEEARRAAEEAQWAAEEAAFGGGGGGGGGREIGGGLYQLGGEEASISSAPSCQFKWRLKEGGGIMALSGWFKCKHAVENMEMELCLWVKYPNKSWSMAECAGKNGRGIVVKDQSWEEMAIVKFNCLTGMVYTGQMWTHEWSGNHTGIFWFSGDIYTKTYPRLVCEGPKSDEYQEIGEIFA